MSQDLQSCVIPLDHLDTIDYLPITQVVTLGIKIYRLFIPIFIRRTHLSCTQGHSVLLQS